jgi:integrase
MPRPKGPAHRIIGIEDRGGTGAGRFRLRFVDGGEPDSRGFATRAQAEAFQKVLERGWEKRAGVTVGQSIEGWLADRAAQGQAVQRYHHRWVPQMLADLTDEPVAGLTTAELADRYKKLADTVAGATSHLAFACLKLYTAYLVDARHTRVDLAEGLSKRGVARAGRAQIETTRELHAYRDELWKRAWGGDRMCLAILISLYCGLRPGETQKLCGRHVDVDRQLVVPGTKTEASWRVLQIESDDLWKLLEEVAEEVGPTGPLCRFPNDKINPKVREVARAAGVANADELVFYSMRGQAASMGRTNGAALRAIADALGQASTRITDRHYVSQKASDVGDQRARFKVLQGGLESDPEAIPTRRKSGSAK